MNLLQQIRDSLSEIDPIPPGVSPKLEGLRGIRAVVFDIYGTLLVSGAGGELFGNRCRAVAAMRQVLSARGGFVTETEAERCLSRYEAEVSRRRAAARKKGVEHPEVDIRDIWRVILERDDFEPEAITFECAVNPVWPMPGGREVLRRLRENDFRLGIVSNAQFYTPPILEALFGRDLAEIGFTTGWTMLSYRFREGKPGLGLFERLREKALEDGIRPEEILYLGNDVEKDILTSRAVGFRTCLFAGDRRSLRLGRRDFAEARVMADAVITELEQITGLLDIGS